MQGMVEEITILKQVTLLVTHYNRSKSLERLLKGLCSMGIKFEEIVVSDDGSEEQHLRKLEELSERYTFKLITASINQGLGHNLNKGQTAVKTALTLYIQEDFVPTEEFKEAYMNAVELISASHELDIVRFFSNFRYSYMLSYKKGFSKMFITRLALDYNKIYLYSDGPHLRRRNF